MNYAVAIVAFVCLLATSYWHIRGHRYYTGPRTQARVDAAGIIVNDDGSGHPPAEKRPIMA